MFTMSCSYIDKPLRTLKTDILKDRIIIIKEWQCLYLPIMRSHFVRSTVPTPDYESHNTALLIYVQCLEPMLHIPGLV